MATNWRRFARFGLYLSLLAILFSVGWYVVQRQFDLVLQISLGLIVIGLAVFALLDPENARQLSDRSPGALWQQCTGVDTGFCRDSSRNQLPGIQE